jgi:hypothetical protein
MIICEFEGERVVLDTSDYAVQVVENEDYIVIEVYYNKELVDTFTFWKDDVRGTQNGTE